MRVERGSSTADGPVWMERYVGSHDGTGSRMFEAIHTDACADEPARKIASKHFISDWMIQTVMPCYGNAGG